MELEANSTPKDGELQKIESNQINVSNRKNQQFYVYLCKKVLEKHDDLVLHALGNATTTSVIAAESLVRNGYAEYVSLETKTIKVEESKAEEGDQKEQKLVQRAKLLITLKKSANFEENMKKSQEIKEENEKYIAKEKEGKEEKTKN